MQSFNEILARLHYLNHPYLTGVGIVCVFFTGVFVLLKNPKSAAYRVFFWMICTITVWFSGNVLSMLNYRDINSAVFWLQVGYSSVPFISVSYYHFYLSYFKRQNRRNRLFLYSLYLVSLLEVIAVWTVKDPISGVYVLYNVGVVFPGFPYLARVLIFGMVQYSIVTLMTALLFLHEYRIEIVPARRKQLGALTVVFFTLIWGCLEWLVCFGISLHIAWFTIPLFVGTLAYAIIHYKAMEIDTVIHRTILWLVTVLLLVAPAGAVNYVIAKLLPSLNPAINIIALSIYLIFFVAYYNRLRPFVDQFFRRRKYDYQTILGKVAEKIATCINIEDLTRNLLTEVCEAMYLRNSLLYIASKDNSEFLLTGRRGYKDVGILHQRDALELFEESDRINMPEFHREIIASSAFCQWLLSRQNVVEREQVEVDPQYEGIKEEALSWFKDNETELIVPLVLENKVCALLGLGKKENLQAYTAKDIDLLRKLGLEAGVTVFNALHYEDLAEKERLDEEMRMGRQIQMTLLPQSSPHIQGLDIQGLMQPAREIGGDYYDFITLADKDDLSIVIGDVSGKGVAAGLFMAMAKTAIHTLSQEEGSPKQILLRANQILHQHISGQKFMTMLYLMWQSKTKTMTYSSAGHEHILIYHDQAQELESVQSGGIMLGMLPDIGIYLEERKFKLELNDKILLYTDGVTEALNKEGERFTLERLKDSFIKNHQKPPEELMRAVQDEVHEFIGMIPQYDDITLVVMEAR
ncbi:MAG: SpoIIE family protein phosphatase [Candidatus Omnitrophica bacterium]|nr:SpoIIE family protein phosphatase [Candidatus Omnitrophota bacterium]MDD5654018.1 SpoIIE family protein phosphatase [Candidatus Omnitrophota bacterium]